MLPPLAGRIPGDRDHSIDIVSKRAQCRRRGYAGLTGVATDTYVALDSSKQSKVGRRAPSRDAGAFRPRCVCVLWRRTRFAFSFRVGGEAESLRRLCKRVRRYLYVCAGTLPICWRWTLTGEALYGAERRVRGHERAERARATECCSTPAPVNAEQRALPPSSLPVPQPLTESFPRHSFPCPSIAQPATGLKDERLKDRQCFQLF
ncbi:unnamed protein product [Arctia plantaginis]|uniref:Uncharacterized protein n=1 Tax=Arctia plantaginis TaxID=874455 RepID=A0A8S0ZM19_ARCPL|nr:unnamed protein product [Arctia plantaginis]